MPWKQLICTAHKDNIDAFEALLENAGAVAVTLEDAAAAPLFEPGPGETPLWPTAIVKALFEIDTDLTDLLLDLTAQWPNVTVAALETLADQPWERAWLEHFRPLDFGYGLWIAPHDFEVPASAQTVIRLDPGLAFGTGTHPTTALCLRWLAEQPDLAGKTVIDFGCGSGILGIAALKRGACNVIAVDNDPQALTATLTNARDNGVEAMLTCHTDIKPETLGADIVLANILASTLTQLRPVLTPLCCPGGWLIMSGILAHQATPLAEAYSTDFEIHQITAEGEWVRIDARRR
ncbi:MAG: 50S ribosomal protein L11 methyltransferase [Planctomycetes bacterium]|nr:50S ribosomal protein L11 methyltransferase [Planctomycetota bacterium]